MTYREKLSGQIGEKPWTGAQVSEVLGDKKLGDKKDENLQPWWSRFSS
jgi:hypothetical protein